MTRTPIRAPSQLPLALISARIWLRRVLRWLLWLVLLLIALLLVWWLGNRIDEYPSTEARRFSAAWTARVADEDNAWLFLVGIGAPEGESPLDYGRQRVDAENARLRQLTVPASDVTEPALFIDAVPQIGPDESIDGTAKFCPDREVDCLVWAQQHRAMLERLRGANALRLQRLQQLQRLSGWQVLYAPRPDALRYPDTKAFALQLNLIALQLQQADPQPSAISSLEPLAQWVDFWRGVQAQPQDVISMLLAARQIEAAQRITNSWLDRQAGRWSNADHSAIERILQARPAAFDWSAAMQYEFQIFAVTLDQAVPGPLQVLQQCLAGSVNDGCLQMLAVSSAYAPQATLNLHASHRAAMQQFLQADPPELTGLEQALERAFERATHPEFSEYSLLLRSFAYNFTGRILAAMPVLDWSYRLHDQDALRRMYLLKAAALRAGLSAQDMPAFLARQPESLRNPYDGSAFGWDASTAELHFVPKAVSYWQRDRLAVSLKFRLEG